MLAAAAAAAALLVAPAASPSPSTAAYAVRWSSLTEPIDNFTGTPKACGQDNGARCSRDAMPLGSGRAAVNAWVDTKGLAFYLADSRALDEYHALHHLGMVQIHLAPNPFFAPANLSAFEQRLDHERALLTVNATTTAGLSVSLELFVDRLQHAVRLRVAASHPVALAAELFLWRGDATFAAGSQAVQDARYGDCGEVSTTTPKKAGVSRRAALPHSGGAVFQAYSHGDTVKRLGGAHSGVAWSWRANASQSVYGRSLQQQQLGPPSAFAPDPLTHLTAGAAIVGTAGPLQPTQPAAGAEVNSTREGIYGSVDSTAAATAFELLVVPHVNRGLTLPYDFDAELEAQVAAAAAVPFDRALAAHSRACQLPRYRWHLGCILLRIPAISLLTGAALWDRSWVIIGDAQPNTEEFNVTQMHLLGRYMDLSQGGGP